MMNEETMKLIAATYDTNTPEDKANFIAYFGLTGEDADSVDWCDVCDQWYWIDDDGYPTCPCV